ncbi:Tripartite tricarboxylate transporter family receptor [Pigmentiphaga humi]|uniref:Tripartite tricarboxylate transporter family receptor n=1 Tax=Pigmentiphaga humi TaxID=2478468 RepID=A0A3P4B954_9BURK|nr:tripartite tricarboxylate transporter substrate binding protein [Pigmentiphaga humi]VCU71675.1 Tripartite tricarboxylate transporter family receptor [Pigmentiphaga humi]
MERNSNIGRRKTIRALARAAMGIAAAAACAAQAAPAEWPTRSVTIVVPYAPGGNTDGMARLLAGRLTQRMGQSFVVDNRGGASGAIGATAVARAKPDGYTLMFAAAAPMIIAPLIQPVNYDPAKDFALISIFGAGPFVIGINSAIEANTLEEFIDYVKKHPGKVSYGSSGHGGISHLASAALAERAGLQMLHVPYKSGAPALNALMSGEVQMYFGNASELIPNMNSSRIKLLATSSAQRMPTLPGRPAVAELFPGFDITSWNGLIAPAGTPQAILDVLAEETAAAARDPAIARQLGSMGILPVGSTPAQFAETFRRDRDFYAKTPAASK